MASITAANAVFMLGITSVFPSPQQLQGFSADDIFGTDPMESAEVSMGVDGRLSGGFVFVPVKQGISLQADSISNQLFDNWFTAQQTAQDTFIANATVLLPGLGKKWTLTRGFLTTYPPIPDAGKLLKPRRFGITWERVRPAASA